MNNSIVNVPEPINEPIKDYKPNSPEKNSVLATYKNLKDFKSAAKLIDEHIEQNKKILLYGFGISGKSCFNYLKKNNDVEIFDDDETLKNKKNRVFFPGFTKVRKNSYDYIVVSPGINIENCKLKKYLKKNYF